MTMIICPGCNKEKKKYAKGLCQVCYKLKRMEDKNEKEVEQMEKKEETEQNAEEQEMKETNPEEEVKEEVKQEAVQERPIEAIVTETIKQVKAEDLETKDKNVKELLKMLLNNQHQLMDEKKVKGFRLPWKAKVGKGKRKNNFCLVIYLNDNRNLDFMKVPIQEATVMIKESPHIASAKYMMTYKNMPVLFIPSWNVEPFDPSQNLNDADKNKSLSVGYRLLLNRMKMEVIKAKTQVNWLLIGGAIVVVVVLILGYFLTKGGGGFKLF